MVLIRNAFNKKYRRHITDNPQRNSGGNERGAARRLHPGMFSSSQLSIEVSELHADINGRLEITCLATIPANVDPGEQYADFKTFSVKSEFLIKNFDVCNQTKSFSRVQQVFH